VGTGRHHHPPDRAAGPERFEHGVAAVKQVAGRPGAAWRGIPLVAVVAARAECGGAAVRRATGVASPEGGTTVTLVAVAEWRTTVICVAERWPPVALVAAAERRSTVVLSTVPEGRATVAVLARGATGSRAAGAWSAGECAGRPGAADARPGRSEAAGTRTGRAVVAALEAAATTVGAGRRAVRSAASVVEATGRRARSALVAPAVGTVARVARAGAIEAGRSATLVAPLGHDVEPDLVAALGHHAVVVPTIPARRLTGRFPAAFAFQRAEA